MSVNPDMSATTSVADEFVDLEHQVIKQDIDLVPGGTVEVTPGDPGAEFSPGERQLDREEIAQLVAYRRYATLSFQGDSNTPGNEVEAVGGDASVGINGDLFRPVTTENVISPEFSVQSGGEIGLLDNYELNALGPTRDDTVGFASGIFAQTELLIPFYDWPTGGPIVDSFDTITCGFLMSSEEGNDQMRAELRYDFWWDVAEQGRSTNPFGRPSTR